MNESCESCVHWQRLQYETHTWPDGETQRIAEDDLYSVDKVAEDDDPNRWGRCGYASQRKDRGGDRLAFTVDGSDYFAALVTRADFGCSAFTSEHP